jgi:hypothetical protein
MKDQLIIRVRKDALMKRIGVAVAMMCATVRCATIAHGRYQRVSVDSHPAGANVRVDCGDARRDGGVTPAVVSIRRGATSCSLTLSKEGYASQTIAFTRRLSSVGWANVVPALIVEGSAEYSSAQSSFLSDAPAGNGSNGNNGLPFLAVAGAAALIDHSTGAMYRQEPARIDVVLQPRN